MTPFHQDPSLELDENNLITLCTLRLCHIEIGHGDNYEMFCPKVREICALVRSKTISRKAASKMAKDCRIPNDPGDEVLT